MRMKSPRFAVSQVEPFRALGLSRLAHQLEVEGRSVIHMEFGQPSTAAPRAALDAARRALDFDPMGYWDSPRLRAGIAERYLHLYGLDIDARRVVLTGGASPAMLLALACSFQPGDQVALARPGYVAYRNALKALHIEPIELACGPEVDFQLTARALAAIDPAPAGVIIASPANPTGTLIRLEELGALAAVARDRKIRIVSDEIYHGITYTEPAHSMLEVAPDALVVNSFSKYFSMPGWRLGWLLCPEDLVDRSKAFADNLFLTPPSLSQHAALAALSAEDELQAHLAVYRRNRSLLLNGLAAIGLDKVAPPDGAFYLYADIGNLTADSPGFCEQLLRQTGVATAPGVDFDPLDGNRFMRFSFAISTPAIEEAIVIAQVVASLRQLRQV
jgi:aspartate/methionine/tyrosine aminotransferase